MNDEPINRRNWHQLANCLGYDTEIFFNTRQGKIDTIKYRKAMFLCNNCPVKRHCLADSFYYDDRDGIRGGLSEFDRGKVNRKNRKLLLDWFLSLR